MTSVAIINKSTVLSDDIVRAAAMAIQKQVLEEFAIAGWPSGEVAFIEPGQLPSSDQYPIQVLDDTSQAGVLGFHDFPQTVDGKPIGFIFAKTDASYGLSPTVTLSHEILETFADPFICNVAMRQTSDTSAVNYAWEICDACEDDSLAYPINGILVSDFVYPAWFQDWRATKSTKFDHMGHIDSPFALAAGGYISTFTPGQGWQQVTAPSRSARMAARMLNQQFKRSNRRINGNK